MPDKAIDLIDEAASRLRLQQESKPEPIQDLDRKVMRLKIEETALLRESDSKSKQRVVEVAKELRTLNDELTRLTELWQAEKDRLGATKETQQQIEDAKQQLEMAKRKGDFDRAGELQHGVLPGLEQRLKEQTEARQQEESMLSEKVSEDDITEVVSRATGIPLQRLGQGEVERLTQMEAVLKSSVAGQDDAITCVAQAVRLARSGLSAVNRPRGSFLFLGPTGVGKTELCKALCSFLFDDEKAMTRIDMSEYTERHSLSRLIGAPPGYVGYEEGGILTEAVRRRPFQVILLDEFEKAHRSIHNLLLQVLDEGCLTDSQGRRVDMSNTIIVMTSNIGSELVTTLPPGAKSSQAWEQVSAVLKQHVLPELLNRVDDVLLFERLRPEHMGEIVDIQVRNAQEMLREKDVKLELSEQVLQWLAKEGFSEGFGARPLRRLFNKTVLNAVSMQLLTGKCKAGDSIRIMLSDLHRAASSQEGHMAEGVEAQKAGAGWQSGVLEDVVEAQIIRPQEL